MILPSRLVKDSTGLDPGPWSYILQARIARLGGGILTTEIRLVRKIPADYAHPILLPSRSIRVPAGISITRCLEPPNNMASYY
jgi:hypothetical protein